MLNKLFKGMTDNIFLQFFRYIFVGGTAFVVDFFFLYFFSVLVNYIMSTKWVFNQRNIENKVLEFNLFILISTIGLIFTEILLYFFTDIVGLYYLISKIISAIIVLIWNFLARRVMFYGKELV